MKTEIKHTPTPWHICAESGEGWIEGFNGIEVLLPFVMPDPVALSIGAKGTSYSDAEFIVRAVNSHEALLDVAKLALHAAEGGVVPELFLKTRLKEAIDRAEGEK